MMEGRSEKWVILYMGLGNDKERILDGFAPLG